MTWFKVDDGFAAHRKVERLQAEYPLTVWTAAVAAWTLLGADCAARLTDGGFTLERARRVTAMPPKTLESALAALVSVGLLEQSEDGYRYHDWDHFNPSRERVLSKRDATKQRVSRWRNGVTVEERNAGRNASPVPSRPVPSRESADALSVATRGDGTPKPEPGSASEVLDALATGSGWHFDPRGSPARERVELARILRERHEATPELVSALAAVLADPRALWPRWEAVQSTGRVTVRQLLGRLDAGEYPAAALEEAVTAARQRLEAERPRPREATTAEPQFTPEEIAATRARLVAIGERLRERIGNGSR